MRLDPTPFPTPALASPAKWTLAGRGANGHPLESRSFALSNRRRHLLIELLRKPSANCSPNGAVSEDRLAISPLPGNLFSPAGFLRLTGQLFKPLTLVRTLLQVGQEQDAEAKSCDGANHYSAFTLEDGIAHHCADDGKSNGNSLDDEPNGEGEQRSGCEEDEENKKDESDHEEHCGSCTAITSTARQVLTSTGSLSELEVRASEFNERCLLRAAEDCCSCRSIRVVHELPPRQTCNLTVGM